MHVPDGTIDMVVVLGRGLLRRGLAGPPAPTTPALRTGRKGPREQHKMNTYNMRLFISSSTTIVGLVTHANVVMILTHEIISKQYKDTCEIITRRNGSCVH